MGTENYLQEILDANPSIIGRVVRILYTNHRGELLYYRVLPVSTEFTSSPWYPEAQWLLHADTEKGRRSFAMKNIHKWEVG